jgi:hypothetical protein
MSPQPAGSVWSVEIIGMSLVVVGVNRLACFAEVHLILLGGLDTEMYSVQIHK